MQQHPPHHQQTYQHLGAVSIITFECFKKEILQGFFAFWCWEILEESFHFFGLVRTCSKMGHVRACFSKTPFIPHSKRACSISVSNDVEYNIAHISSNLSIPFTHYSSQYSSSSYHSSSILRIHLHLRRNSSTALSGVFVMLTNILCTCFYVKSIVN